MLRYVLVLGLVTLVSGEECCVPDAMEGVVGILFGTIVDGMSVLVKGRAMVHQNVTLGMMVIEEEMFLNGTESNMTIINDYNKEIQYAITNGSCTKFILKEMMPRCIPENATLVQDTYLGAESEKILVNTYKFMIANIETYFTVTASGCIPILMVLSLPMAPNRNVGMEVLEFTGITMGVKDPSIFYIPPICQSLNMQKIPTGNVPIMSRLGRSVFH